MEPTKNRPTEGTTSKDATLWWPVTSGGRTLWVLFLVVVFFAGAMGRASHRLGGEGLEIPLVQLVQIYRILTPLDVFVGLVCVAIAYPIAVMIRAGYLAEIQRTPSKKTR